MSDHRWHVTFHQTLSLRVRQNIVICRIKDTSKIIRLFKCGWRINVFSEGEGGPGSGVRNLEVSGLGRSGRVGKDLRRRSHPQRVSDEAKYKLKNRLIV